MEPDPSTSRIRPWLHRSVPNATPAFSALIESGDGERKWSTVGVSYNIIEASWQALLDAIDYKLQLD